MKKLSTLAAIGGLMSNSVVLEIRRKEIHSTEQVFNESFAFSEPSKIPNAEIFQPCVVQHGQDYMEGLNSKHEP